MEVESGGLMGDGPAGGECPAMPSTPRMRKS